MKSQWIVLPLLAMALIWGGCTTQVNVQGLRNVPVLLAPDDGVAIVTSDELTDFVTDAEACISKALKDGFPTLRIVTSEEFNRQAFPDPASGKTVRASSDLSLLLKDNGFKERIKPLGVHYLILIGGETEQFKAEPIFGIQNRVSGIGVAWNRVSDLSASILDLKAHQSVGSIWVEASGRPSLVCIGVLVFCAPVGAAAFTESEACGSFGESVAKFLKGEELPLPRTWLKIPPRTPLRIALEPQLPPATPIKITPGQKLFLKVTDKRNQEFLGYWQTGAKIRTSNSLKTVFDQALRERFSDLGFEIIDSPQESAPNLELIIEHFEVWFRSEGYVDAQVKAVLYNNDQLSVDKTYTISNKIEKVNYSADDVEQGIDRSIADIVLQMLGDTEPLLLTPITSAANPPTKSR